MLFALLNNQAEVLEDDGVVQWPASLPPRPAVRGRYEESPPDVLIRTQMEVGPPKVRRRFTAGIRPIACTVRLTTDQKHALDDFFVEDLNYGVEKFSWVHPTRGTPAVYQFRRPPVFTVLDQGIWEAALELDLWPS